MVGISSVSARQTPEWQTILLTVGVSIVMVVSLIACGFCKKLLRRIAKRETKAQIKLAPESFLIKHFSSGKTKSYTIQAPLKKATSKGSSLNLKGQDEVDSTSETGSYSRGETHDTSKLVKTSTTKYTEKTLGSLHLRLLYCPSMAQLNVTLICAKNLPAMDVNGLSDPYCKIMLFPHQRKKMTSKVVQKTLNPYWNQTLCVKIPEEELPKQTLFIYVWDRDRIGRDDMIGEIRLVMDREILVNIKRGESLWREIQASRGVQTYRGQLLISLCYQTHSQALIVNILKAKGLPAMDVLTNSSDPYVKICWYYKSIAKEKRRTKVIKQCLSPVFNETFSFHMSVSMMQRSSLLLTVKDYDTIGGNDTIGYIVMGKHKGETEKKHWSQTINNPMHTVAEWYHIQKHKPI